MIAEEAYVLSKSFTNNSLKGIAGTLAGKNCTIKSTTKADGVTTVVFAWTADDGTEKTTTIQVNDGAKGEIGDKGDKGDKGEKGIDGTDGYSPTVVENANNTEDNYKLDITTKTTSYTTPNLKGKQGVQGLQGIQGEAGKDGKDGTTYTPSIGEVTTVDSNELASASVSVNTETKEAVFNFAIPKGNKGLDGVQISDNETVENKTWSSSKIASEIPTTLPANGGNANTVNNHTVKSDVPENAVFTDTIYDDTELKGSVTALSDRVKTVEDNYANITKVDVPVTDVTFTSPNVSKIGYEICKYCVKNGVCYVTLNGLTFSSSYVNREDFVVLPKPVMRQDFELTNSFGTTVLGKLFLEPNGYMHLYTSTIPVTTTGYISFSYPVAES